MMALEFISYVPPQLRPQKLKRQQHAVSLPQNHIQIPNAAEDLDDMWPPQCAGETVKEIADETPGSPDELPSIEELWKAERSNGNTSARPSVPSTFTSLDYITSSTSHVQTDSDKEISRKTQNNAIIINEDTNLDQSIDSSRSLQSMDMTFLAPANVATDGSINIVREDADDNQLSAAKEWLCAQIESDPAPIHSETTDSSTVSSIEALSLAPATQISAEIASFENSDAEASNKSASTSPAAEDPPTPSPVADGMSEDEWEAVEIIGEKMINGKLYYRVDWKPTLEPEESCVNMRELIEEWKKSKIRRRKGGKRTGSRTAQLAQEAGVSKKSTKRHEEGKKSNNKDSTKRPRGRPRKL
ncbi:hypothetical protein V2G26_001816 [Clonostachys chloroleuca]